MKKALAATVLALVLAAPALADPTLGVPVTAPPINLNACNLQYDGTNIAGRVTGVAIQFTNESTKLADLINFNVNINGQNSVIRDVGTFTPGIEITHKFRAGSDQFALPAVLSQLFGRPSVTCSVASVHFPDGSTWQPAALTRSVSLPIATGTLAPPAVSVTPASLDFAGASAASRLILVSGRAPTFFSPSSNCAHIATIQVAARAAQDTVYSVTPIGSGYCAVTFSDGTMRGAMVPIVVH
jgi:hypothetical protein